ncbi:MAG: LysR family transcriptional regulator, partial [Shewanella sp.]
SNFHEAKTILASNIGFCWIPNFVVQQELANKQLVRLHLRGSSQRKIIMNLLVPDRDNQGPASKLLESLILQQHNER